jgi:hypothetical protein
MRRFILCFFLWYSGAELSLYAQTVGVNVSVGVRKTFKISKKDALDLRQQFQITPDIERYDNEFGDLFNEDGLWPIPDRRTRKANNDDDNDDDDDDDDDNLSNNNGSNNNGKPWIPELDDRPVFVNLDWRTTFSAQYSREWFRWLRSATGYAFQYDGRRAQHSLRAELDYRPLRYQKGKRALDVAARVGFQTTGTKRKNKNTMRWDYQLTPRIDLTWNFKKEHTITWSNGLNGMWDKGIFLFDRWRSNVNLNFIYRKNHRFVLSFQRQQRIDKRRISHGASLGYEVRF